MDPGFDADDGLGTDREAEFVLDEVERGGALAGLRRRGHHFFFPFFRRRRSKREEI